MEYFMPPLAFVIGDSISIQYGPYLEKMLGGRWRYARKGGQAEAMKNLDIPRGANGGDSSMVLAYLREKTADGSFRPDVLLLNCGLHDIKTDPKTQARQVPLDNYRANLREIVALIRATGARLVWARTTPVVDRIHNAKQKGFSRYATDVAAYNAAADEVMAQAGAISADLHAFTESLGGEEVFCDHVHFTEPVRQLQAAFLAGVLEALR